MLGGGLVGMGYHAGALKALLDWGIDPAEVDVSVGTSTGAVIGAYLAAGWGADDFYDYAHGRHAQAGETIRLLEQNADHPVLGAAASGNGKEARR